MLTDQQINALTNQLNEDITNAGAEKIDDDFTDSYELALTFFSEETSLPNNLQGLEPEELRKELNKLTYDETSNIVNELIPKSELSPEQVYSWIWIRGARDINKLRLPSEEKSLYATFIRDYTIQQIEFRNINERVEAQAISNGIARNLIEDLIGLH